MPTVGYDAVSLSLVVFNFIRSILPKGSTMVEIGSGFMSHKLAEHYDVYSIEDDPRFICACPLCSSIHYIFAPQVNGFYDRKIIERDLPKKYDLLLWDGPYATHLRPHLLDNLDLFKWGAPIIIDDVNVPVIKVATEKLAEYLNRPLEIKPADDHRLFGYIA